MRLVPLSENCGKQAVSRHAINARPCENRHGTRAPCLCIIIPSRLQWLIGGRRADAMTVGVMKFAFRPLLAMDHIGARPMSFGKYRLLEEIGSGGMATVHRAILAGPEGFELQL